jgi:rod shape-determining protein MreC
MLIFFGLVLLCFLAFYTLDARTGRLSRLAGMGGLELTRQVLSPGIWLKDRFMQLVRNYLALAGTAEENVRLTEKLSLALQSVEHSREEGRELGRLRLLLDLPPLSPWEKTGARVIAGKFGPQAVLNSVMLNKGFLGGALPGSPVVTAQGLVGRVLYTAPHSATVLLITDPSFRVAVVGQESRVRGILSGAGPGKPLLVQYVAPNTNMRPGELLICSGIDGITPRGVPAARVSSVLYGKDMLFPEISSAPLADLSRLEEVLVLIPPKGARADELLYEPFKDIDILPDVPELDQLADEENAAETEN